jgi:phosphomannomutase
MSHVSTTATIDLYCPGETHPISLALHLARLAESYPACRGCVHRGETGTLSGKLVKRLKAVWADGHEPASFHDGGFGGQSPSDLTPGMARQAAAALGLWLRRSGAEASECRIAIANDARTITPEYVAATSEGLCWASCAVFDIGPATSAAVEFSMEYFRLNGGILLGNEGGNPSSICLKFWSSGPRRIQGKSSFQPLEVIMRHGLDRPERSFGPQHRLQAETPYLAAIAAEFHGLRPLRFVADSSSRPWVAYLEKLLGATACRIIPCRVLPHEFSRQITDDQAHFGICVRNDGETCTFFNEQGYPLDDEIISNAIEPLGLEETIVPRDALTRMARFLQLLSRDDRPCSEVLDVAAVGK